jgi:hypothetical protein
MRRIVAALAVLAAAGLTPPAADADLYGAAISPVPLIVEHWAEPAVTVENRGTLPIDGGLVIDGDGYALALERLHLEELGRADVPLAAIGDGEAIITATITTQAEGVDAAALVLTTNVRHRSPLEDVAWPLILLAAAAVVVGGLWAVRRRMPPWMT